MLSRARLGWRGAEHANRSWHVVDAWGLGLRAERRLCCLPVAAFIEGLVVPRPSALSKGVRKLRAAAVPWRGERGGAGDGGEWGKGRGTDFALKMLATTATASNLARS